MLTNIMFVLMMTSSYHFIINGGIIFILKMTVGILLCMSFYFRYPRLGMNISLSEMVYILVNEQFGS